MSSGDMVSVDYEIYGRVQGVFFRKYTQAESQRSSDRPLYQFCALLKLVNGNIEAEGKKLGLVGWVQNTAAGTVQGQLQGPRSKVKEMQEWLKTTGSPNSRIIKAEFTNEKTIDNLQHSSFKIVR